MHEIILKKYFEGKIDFDQLNDDLIGVSVKRGPKETSQEIVDMDQEFLVKPEHIIGLLQDVIIGKIEPGYLEPISFALMGSDYFIFDYEDTKTDLTLKLLHEWASPEINYELNLENIKRCLQELERV